MTTTFRPLSCGFPVVFGESVQCTFIIYITFRPTPRWSDQLSGLLKARLVSVSGLPTRGGVRALFGQDQPDVYGVLSVGRERRQTAVTQNTVQHTYQEDWMKWAVEEVEGHLLELNMYDQDRERDFVQICLGQTGGGGGE